MDMIHTYCTDVGTVKKTNQDSVLLKSAKTTAFGSVLLAAVFDGMGGLQKGELASAQLVFRFDQWFSNELPRLLFEGFNRSALRESMTKVLSFANMEIFNYGKAHNISLGSTATIMLIVGSEYLIAHIGDTRVYRITGAEIEQLTVDQTVVQRDLERGLITPMQAKTHTRRNVLLQCVGTSRFTEPVFLNGIMARDTVYMICSDGFRHEITDAEIKAALAPTLLTGEEKMKAQGTYLIEQCKKRGEKDNISTLLIRTL